jgi:glycosyltransferase involved in cell wall biosynthesis
MSWRSGAPKVALLVHNRYQQPGGEDVQFESDAASLERRGHAVVRYERHNDEIDGYGRLGKVRLPVETVWSRRSARDLTALLAGGDRPDVAHVYNTFPLISPSALATCHRFGVPVVLSVANYRLECSNAVLYRDGHVCEDCVRRTVKWPAVRHRCYRQSVPQSAVVASALTIHGVLGTWARHADVLLAVSDAVRDLLVGAGWPADLVHVRHNTVEPDPGPRPVGADAGFALFVGRLSPEKGIGTLVDAAAAVPDLPVRIAGDGPSRAELEERARERGAGNVTFLGRRPRPEALDLMRAARVLVVPSVWREPFGYVAVEAMACGLPVIASDAGGLRELIGPEVGRTYRAGDVAALAAHLRWAADRPEEVERLRPAARARFEATFSSEAGYDRLVELYELGAERFARRQGSHR